MQANIVGIELSGLKYWRLESVSSYYLYLSIKNLPPQLNECEELNSDICSGGNVLWFNISSC